MTRDRLMAFTLVELLVVILIITILTALLLPTIENAREAAYSVACADRQRQLMMITHEYGLDARIILGQQLSVYKDDGTKVNMLGYHLLYEGGYLLPDNFNVVNYSNLNTVANAWRKGNSSLVMCPTARFHGHSITYQAGGLEEVVYPGDKNHWRDLWAIGGTGWTWGNDEPTAFTVQFNQYYGASAVSSYSMQAGTRYGACPSTDNYIYTPLHHVKNPSRRIWWMESKDPLLASLYTFEALGKYIAEDAIAPNSRPNILLPHPYAMGGNYVAYDGHVGQYNRDEMVASFIDCGGNTSEPLRKLQPDWNYEFFTYVSTTEDEAREGVGKY